MASRVLRQPVLVALGRPMCQRPSALGVTVPAPHFVPIPAPRIGDPLSPTCHPDDPDSPDLTGSQPLSPAQSRKRQAAVMTVEVGAVLGVLVTRRADSTPGASRIEDGQGLRCG